MASYWKDEENQPAEDIPPVVTLPESTEDVILTTPEQVCHLESPQSDPPGEVPPLDKTQSKADGLNTTTPEDAETNAGVLTQSYQRRPLLGKIRPRRRRERNPVRPEKAAAAEDEEEEEPDKDEVRIHGLSVRRYKEIYYSVLTPAALSALPTNDPAEYTAQVLELKQRLWEALCRPRLQETVAEDGRVHVSETFEIS